MTQHAELIARLEAAEMGSRELDALVHVAVADDPNTYVVEPHPDSMFSHQPGWYRTGNDLSVLADPVTTSLDAALALAERVLPSAYLGIQQNRGVEAGCSWSAFLECYDKQVEAMESIETDAHTAPLALCIAILKALEAKA